MHVCTHTFTHTCTNTLEECFLACVSTQFEYTPKCATHWSFINPFDNVVCEVCSCQSDRGPGNLVVSPLQVSEKGAGGVPEPVDEPSSWAAVVNRVGICTSYSREDGKGGWKLQFCSALLVQSQYSWNLESSTHQNTDGRSWCSHNWVWWQGTCPY